MLNPRKANITFKNIKILFEKKPTRFSPSLQNKINSLIRFRSKTKIGTLALDGPLILAPMASICHAPFRKLMRDLGSSCSISELISADGIIHGNKKNHPYAEVFQTRITFRNSTLWP